MSTPARRANHKAEQKMQQYAEAQQSSAMRRSFGGGSFLTEAMGPDAFNRSSASMKEAQTAALVTSSKEREQAFKESAAEVDGLILGLTSSLRLDGASSKSREEQRLAKEREEARRRQAAEERAAREKEAEARDPHKKVNLRLENTRKYNMDSIEELGVPMQQVDFVGHAGVDSINMVDVLSMRRKCKQLSGGCTPSVRDLIDDQTRHDRLHGFDPKTGKPKSASTSNLPEAVATLKLPAEQATLKLPAEPDKENLPITPSKLVSTGKQAVAPPREGPLVLGLTEEKRLQVESQKSQIFIATMLKKMNSMRSEPSENTLANLEQIAERGQYHRQRAMKHAGGDTLGSPTGDGELGGSRELTPRALLKNTRKKLEGAPAVKDKPKAKRAPKPQVAMDPKAHKRAVRRWNIARLAVYAHYLYSTIKKKRDAIGKVKSFVAFFGEWARVRLSMQRLSTNIRILQSSCRHFLSSKKKRCELMAKEWQRVEDKHLAPFFKALAQQALMEQTLKEARAKEGTVKAELALKKQKNNVVRNMMKESIDWKQFRIPKEERKAVLGRFYIVNLKKKIRNQQHLYRVVQEVVRKHNETVGFLRKFGADAAHARDLRNMALGASALENGAEAQTKAEFWHLTEERALDLIAFAAHQKRSTDPWHNHPSNFDRPDNRMYRPALKTSGGEGDILGMMTEARPTAARSSKKVLPVGPVTKQPLENKQAEAPVDIDELWRTFTPRMFEAPARPDSQEEERPSSRPGLGDQDQVAWRLG